ncbi:uncharacterized protein LOC119676253 [Teleopsis dalmanni]|uniref:uncharacterized protein LOC119676253 n=1 Tax=Teleopsis dalmanni TaxID=139649 RepID=UPI0018CCC9AA|nr:uncharacterized protein LOC119676253 [Teleopsis dalmanni]
MLQPRLLLLCLLTASLTVYTVRASSHLNNINSVNSADSYDKQDTWQPMSRNNWIILQTAAGKSAARTQPTRKHTHTYTYTKTHPHIYAQTPRHPVNYYAYNQSGGNYQSDIKPIEPYVLQISHMRRTDTSPGSTSTRHKLPASTIYSRNSPKDVMSANSISPNKHLNRLQDIDSSVDGTDDDAADSPSLAAADYTSDDVEDIRLNEMFVPLRNTLDKVIDFCDAVKYLISSVDDAADENVDVNADEETKDDTDTEDNEDVYNVGASGEVQGHNSISSIRAFGKPATNELSIGTGRKSKKKKLKKQFKKLLLPLLLAYKLKFITLVPVLVAGLTLLVGSTGVAGFFFALFAAVMSLKSTGHAKSIIVKDGSY